MVHLSAFCTKHKKIVIILQGACGLADEAKEFHCNTGSISITVYNGCYFIGQRGKGTDLNLEVREGFVQERSSDLRCKGEVETSPGKTGRLASQQRE